MIEVIDNSKNIQKTQITSMNREKNNSDFHKRMEEKKGEKLLNSFIEDSLYIKEDKETITLKDFKRAYQITFNKIENYLKETYKKYNLKSNLKADFKIDRTGKVFIANNHPNKNKLEELINNNDEIENLFRKLSSLKSIIEHAEEHLKFKNLYNKNPKLAVAKYSYLFDDENHDSFTLSYKDRQMEIEYIMDKLM